MTTLPPLSLVGIGRYLRAAWDRYSMHDSAYVAADLDSSEKHAAEVEMRWSLNEIVAWQSLAMAHRPKTLADAAAQLGILFDLVANIDASDLGEQVKEGTLKVDLETAKRAIAGLAVMVASMAGVDLVS
jgi:hypothetical protein